MIKVAVCDDEEHVLDYAVSLLQEFRQGILSVDAYQSGEELLESGKEYTIILLDIDMQGMDGIETARKIRDKDRNVKLIYVTNYSDYMTFAFAVHAFAYLLKPIKREELYAQLEEAISYGATIVEKELELITKEGVLRIKPSCILYFEYQEREVILHTEEKIWHLKKRITDIAAEMKQYDFGVPHKSFVVNFYWVQSIKGYNIIMANGSIIPLSQKKSVEFRRSLNQYLTKEMSE